VPLPGGSNEARPGVQDWYDTSGVSHGQPVAVRARSNAPYQTWQSHMVSRC